jgi:hypothetical protein
MAPVESPAISPETAPNTAPCNVPALWSIAFIRVVPTAPSPLILLSITFIIVSDSLTLGTIPFVVAIFVLTAPHTALFNGLPEVPSYDTSAVFILPALLSILPTTIVIIAASRSVTPDIATGVII